MLINAGADVNLGNNNGRTPLMIACKFLNQDSILALLESKDINLNLKDDRGNIALEDLLYSVRSDTEKINITKVFIEKKMDISIKFSHDQDFLPGLMERLQHKTDSFKDDIIKILLDTDIDLSLFDDCSYVSGFEYVCQYASEETIKYCFKKHTYYDEAILKKCIIASKHKKVVLDILENLYANKISFFKAY